MGKKRKRAVVAEGDVVEIDPLYFDNPTVGGELPPVEIVAPLPSHLKLHPANEEKSAPVVEETSSRDSNPAQSLSANKNNTALEVLKGEETDSGEKSLNLSPPATGSANGRDSPLKDKRGNHQFDDTRDWTDSPITSSKNQEADDNAADITIISDTTNGGSDEIIEILTSSPVEIIGSSPAAEDNHSMSPGAKTGSESYLNDLSGKSVSEDDEYEEEADGFSKQTEAAAEAPARAPVLATHAATSAARSSESSKLFVSDFTSTAGSTSSLPASFSGGSSHLPSSIGSAASAYPVEIVIACKIPGRAATRTQTWSSNVPFYSLEKEFGRESVLVCNGQVFKKFQTPGKLAPNMSSLEIQVVTQLQWRAMQLGEDAVEVSEEREAISDEDNVSEAKEEEKNRFPITLEGREGKVRVLVSPTSNIGDLTAHYLNSKQLPANSTVTVKFDGDVVDPSSVLGDLDVEEDDKLDFYVS